MAKKKSEISTPEDAFLQFVETRCIFEGKTKIENLYDSFREWCRSQGKAHLAGAISTFCANLWKSFPGKFWRRRATEAGKRIWIYDGISIKNKQ